ncbi:MFS transporter [Pseudoduganella buxea]|uniref:MFS transporter n=1 Tax=Pseudoduganella buxea TaxID=1949069 RepID=A0A6I3SQ95_9BURK|nr:MFS transporter [Pseudoduganella buxea]MTV51250.1 MFS transporter [Pseudoduganella buxea]GGB96908.1 MFS transporter [Pseudoduganella buxea]
MKAAQRNPWSWVPTLYYGQGIPYFTAMTLALVMYKNTGFSNSEIAFYTSWLYLPWVIKPLWAPVVDMFGTKRGWVVALQAAIGGALALVAFTTHLPAFFQVSLAVLWLMAFSSATHDIAADGFYMLGLTQKQQAGFVGVRSTFYRLANITGQGVLVALSGLLIRETGDPHVAWAIIFALLGGVFAILAVYHYFMLPHPADDHPVRAGAPGSGEFFAAFASFFKKDGIVVILAFLLLFRLGESQLLKMAVPFLLDPLEKGGLGLDNEKVGLVYGTVGVIALTLGGLLGGVAIARFGLKRCLWPMAFIVHLPDLVFIYLSTALPQNIFVISAAMAVEQFGYGFGFTSYMMFMIMVSDGEHKTAHYAICTGFMAMGMMLPQMASGYLQQMMGYQNFFIWACLATIPAFVITALVRIDPAFGRD